LHQDQLKEQSLLVSLPKVLHWQQDSKSSLISKNNRITKIKDKNEYKKHFKRKRWI
jgi:hypothetical protein